MPCHKKKYRPNETTTNFGYVIYVVYHVIYLRERERETQRDKEKERERQRERDRERSYLAISLTYLATSPGS
jgi:hypothetical protein